MCPAWLRINIDPSLLKADLTTNFPKKQPSCFLRPTPEERRPLHCRIPHVAWSTAKRRCCRISSRRYLRSQCWCGHPNRPLCIRPRSGYPMSPPAPGSAGRLKAQLYKETRGSNLEKTVTTKPSWLLRVPHRTWKAHPKGIFALTSSSCWLILEDLGRLRKTSRAMAQVSIQGKDR